ncbi:hypothetical protein CPC08DRAFT_284799 [Agrocybe pediades]|nr:hypothetical protein CPC08DRAFT_284799 [Agrocybe pediades]
MSNNTFNTTAPREPRRVSMACTYCRHKKLKCRVDAGQTRCQRCVQNNNPDCRFIPVSVDTASAADWQDNSDFVRSADGTMYYDQSSAGQQWPDQFAGGSVPLHPPYPTGGSQYMQTSYGNPNPNQQQSYSAQGHHGIPSGHPATNQAAYNPYLQPFQGPVHGQVNDPRNANPAMQYHSPQGYVNLPPGAQYGNNAYNPYAQSSSGMNSRDGAYMHDSSDTTRNRGQ